MISRLQAKKQLCVLERLTRLKYYSICRIKATTCRRATSRWVSVTLKIQLRERKEEAWVEAEKNGGNEFIRGFRSFRLTLVSELACPRKR